MSRHQPECACGSEGRRLEDLLAYIDETKAMVLHEGFPSFFLCGVQRQPGLNTRETVGPSCLPGVEISSENSKLQLRGVVRELVASCQDLGIRPANR